MAGHSKWANIKHKKGAADAKRSKIFTKIIKELTVAARIGGGDASANPRLRLAIEKAKANSMPKDNLERAIKRGTGETEGVNYEEISYEGYGVGGVAVFVECLTDNKTRTVAEVRTIFSKNGGNLGESGSVAWMFERKGQIILGETSSSEEEIFEKAIEAGADDVSQEDGRFVIITSFEDFVSVKTHLEKNSFPIEKAEVIMKPKNTIKIESSDDAIRIFKLIDALEDNDDVQNVWSNFDIDEDIMNSLGS